MKRTISENALDLHVVPEHDTFIHNPHPTCSCHPTMVPFQGGGHRIFTHKAHDGRNPWREGVKMEKGKIWITRVVKRPRKDDGIIEYGDRLEPETRDRRPRLFDE